MSACEDFVPSDAMYGDRAWEVVCDEVDRLRAERACERAEYERIAALLREFGVTFERWRAQTYVALSTFLSVLPSLDQLVAEPAPGALLANNASLTQRDERPACRCSLDAPTAAKVEFVSNGSPAAGTNPVSSGLLSGIPTSTLEVHEARAI